jgi:hypothetical protein
MLYQDRAIRRQPQQRQPNVSVDQAGRMQAESPLLDLFPRQIPNLGHLRIADHGQFPASFLHGGSSLCRTASMKNSLKLTRSSAARLFARARSSVSQFIGLFSLGSQ